MENFKIAITPGHTPNQPGSSHGNITEYGLSMAVIGDIIFRLDKMGHKAWIVDSNTNFDSDQTFKINELNPDFGFRLQFNSGHDATICGTEVLHSGSKNGYAFADELHNSIIDTLCTKDLGTPEEPCFTILKETNCVFAIIKPLFLSNSSDFEKIDITLISFGIVKGLLNYWRRRKGDYW